MTTAQHAEKLDQVVDMPVAALGPWPRAVAWLAVIAHVCVALAIWRAPHGRDIFLSNALGFAQVSLIVMWLILGSAHLVRRLPWSLCGLSAIALAHSSGPPLAVDNLALAHVLVQAAMVAAFILPIRFLRYRLLHLDPTISSSDARSSSQFSIADLLAAAFAVAMAGAIVIRIPPPEWVFTNIEVIKTLATSAFTNLWPLALIAVLAVGGMRNDRWLGWQVLLSGLIALLPASSVSQSSGEPDAWLSFSNHWFLVAGTLCIFQMCGCRLVLTTASRLSPKRALLQSR